MNQYKSGAHLLLKGHDETADFRSLISGTRQVEVRAPKSFDFRFLSDAPFGFDLFEIVLYQENLSSKRSMSDRLLSE